VAAVKLIAGFIAGLIVGSAVAVRADGLTYYTWSDLILKTGETFKGGYIIGAVDAFEVFADRKDSWEWERKIVGCLHLRGFNAGELTRYIFQNANTKYPDGTDYSSDTPGTRVIGATLYRCP
jgi:hypothetical protein